MIVVSDTSPLTALLTIGRADLLPGLFGQVIIPEAVRDELLRSHRVLPGWLKTEPVKDKVRVQEYAAKVDNGEAEAIELALEIHADRVLIDERKGRKLANEAGLRVIGLVGVLLLAKREGLIPSARQFIVSLETRAGFYLSPEVREAALKSIGE